MNRPLIHEIIISSPSIHFPSIMVLIVGYILQGYLPSVVIPTNFQCQSDIPGHYSNFFGMNSQQLNILKEAYNKLLSQWIGTPPALREFLDPGDISSTLGKFPRSDFEKRTSLLNTQWIFDTIRFHARLPVWAYNNEAS